jgi:uncharacterized membrane protein YuzA (DUF378 family)
MKSLDWVAWVLVIIGALNWGFIGLVNLNFVQSVFGIGTALTQFVYILIGLGGLYMVWIALSKKK